MNILLLGSGGREHALAWKIAQSPLTGNLFIAPGNAGTSQVGTNLPIASTDFTAIKQAVLNHEIEMVVVGPEDPLVLGIHDFFADDPDLRHIAVIGPKKEGALLEGSKDFAKDFMNRHHIPTARHKTFDQAALAAGIEFLHTLKPPYVLKADGLAAGKGVIICQSLDEARLELTAMLAHSRFGEASRKVVIEEFLKGPELSVFILTDGKNYILLPEAKDYKKIGENDTGPNTGGMGSLSPVPFADNVFMQKVIDKVIEPTVNGLRHDFIPYAGFIFFGLIKVDNEPFVIEYNCRLGDPETESVIPRIESDLVPLLKAIANQSLDKETIKISPRMAATVMLVSKGYPGDYAKGKVITGEENIQEGMAFHAGTTRNAQTGEIVTSGGRVIALTTLDESLARALKKSYENAGKIAFDGKSYRSDIGFDIV